MTHFVTTFPLRGLPERISFSVAVDEAAALVATAFGEIDQLIPRADLGELQPDLQRTKDARNQVEAYFAGKLSDFSLSLAPRGTAFQQTVWAELQRIPFGETRSYGALARQLKSSPRAVGRANATNPICLIIPCHRVIGADGSLTGFAFGQDVKRHLLDHETTHRRTRAR